MLPSAKEKMGKMQPQERWEVCKYVFPLAEANFAHKQKSRTTWHFPLSAVFRRLDPVVIPAGSLHAVGVQTDTK